MNFLPTLFVLFRGLEVDWESGIWSAFGQTSIIFFYLGEMMGGSNILFFWEDVNIGLLFSFVVKFFTDFMDDVGFIVFDICTVFD